MGKAAHLLQEQVGVQLILVVRAFMSCPLDLCNTRPIRADRPHLAGCHCRATSPLALRSKPCSSPAPKLRTPSRRRSS